jgi:hypothetical protein
MTVKEWHETQMDDSRKARAAAYQAAEIAEARFYAFKEVFENLPAGQMEIQIAAEGAAKEQ